MEENNRRELKNFDTEIHELRRKLNGSQYSYTPIFGNNQANQGEQITKTTVTKTNYVSNSPSVSKSLDNPDIYQAELARIRQAVFG